MNSAKQICLLVSASSCEEMLSCTRILNSNLTAWPEPVNTILIILSPCFADEEGLRVSQAERGGGGIQQKAQVAQARHQHDPLQVCVLASFFRVCVLVPECLMWLLPDRQCASSMLLALEPHSKGYSRELQTLAKTRCSRLVGSTCHYLAKVLQSTDMAISHACRFRSMVQPRPAVVSIMADGSVMVTTAGMEMGQGMFTKVKQVCG